MEGRRSRGWSACVDLATQRIDGSSLAVARVAAGSVAVLSAARVWSYGWVDTLYAGPTHRFAYPGLGWVPQPSGAGARGLLAVVAVAGVALALGWRTRVATAVLLVAFGWLESIDATVYLNHYWFLTLLLGFGVVSPWGAALSLDARRRGGPSPIARGWVWAARFQVGIVYAAAGLAKLQGDWLIRAEPLVLWLPARGGHLPFVGGLMAEPATAHVLSVAGAAFDCLVVPALLWRRTRLAAWIAALAFHVATWVLFPIGVFPWLMMAVATVFFEPDWPRRVRRRLAGPVEAAAPAGTALSPVPSPSWRHGAWTAVAVVWVAVQVLLPLRHFAYPGDHRWTGQGYRFAWNVLLVEKSGSVTFRVHDPATGITTSTDGRDLYTDTQVRVMSTEPDLIHRAARQIAADAAADGREVEVRVDAWASINGGPPARLIDPDVDLAAEPLDPWDDDWITDRPR